MGPHEEFLELCAVSTSGELTQEERNGLEAHLTECVECREARKHFEALTDRAIPALAPDLATEIIEVGWSSSSKRTEAAFLERLRRRGPHQAGSASGAPTVRNLPEKKASLFQSRLRRAEFWLPSVAGILLLLTLGILILRGRTQSSDLARTGQGNEPTQKPSAESQRVAWSSVPGTSSANSAEEDDQVIGNLRHQMELQRTETARLKTKLKALESNAETTDADKNRIAQERDALAQKLQTEEAALEKAQAILEAREQYDSNDSARVSALEAKIADLAHLLDDQDKTIDRERVLLERDRDIRELMGARDLYIAEVYDVGRTGETQKPCGRVFLTKGKSLIFYAFDLDQQPALKDGSSFQAWGQHGPDRGQAFNLGIFYEDNASKKRWVVKSENSRTLAQIDAVFVTVEPKGGSIKPSSKPLLFAYLKVNSNHP